MASALVSIGDELLGGFTLDTNSHWLAERLRLRGYPLKRVSTIRDREGDIVSQLERDLGDPEVSHVFCQGGLGPTPDDRTFPAVARGLGRELEVWEPTRERIQRRLDRLHEAGLIESPAMTEGSLKMARIPAAPRHVFRNRKGMAPGVVYEASGKQLFVLPGVPMELKSIYEEELEPEFLPLREASQVRELHFEGAIEGTFYPFLREAEETYPDVSVGSYPNFETKVLVLRVSGADPDSVARAVRLLKRRVARLGIKPTRENLG